VSPQNTIVPVDDLHEVFLFYRGISSTARDAFETPAWLRTGDAVGEEVARSRRVIKRDMQYIGGGSAVSGSEVYCLMRLRRGSRCDAEVRVVNSLTATTSPSGTSC